MASIIDEDEAHNDLIEEITKSNFLKRKHDQEDTNEETLEIKSKNSFTDILSNLAKSKSNSSKKSKKLKTEFKAKNKCPKTDRLEREANYNNSIKQDMDKWDIINRQNERKNSVTFPLTVSNSKILQAEKKLNQNENFHFAARSELEHKLQDLFQNSSKILPKSGEDLSVLEKNMLAELSKHEIESRISNLRNKRLKISVQEAKNKRTKKIKSKNYRRRQRRIMEKENEKILINAENDAKEGKYEDLETLKINEEKERILERASLRHKHTSKKVKEVKRYNKFNEQERLNLAEREKLHKELIKSGKQAILDQENYFKSRNNSWRKKYQKRKAFRKNRNN